MDEKVKILMREANATADFDSGEPPFLPQATHVALGGVEDPCGIHSIKKHLTLLRRSVAQRVIGPRHRSP
jgi:hypothetical protein